MPRIRSSPAAHNALPKVSFQRIEDKDFSGPPGVADQQARSYGYCDFNEFVRPQHYIRHIEPLESELATQVEYDMDEQDQEWLDTVNAERKKEQLGTVTYEVFEIIMDRLEKEWFDLTKNIPKPDFAMPSEDSTCAICDDSEGENSNAIVFCDGCNLAVHQDCYGVPYIPEGQWLCRKCTVSPENPVSCILCPNEGGAFKQTVHGDWVHLLCAIWVPETRVANEVFMEPVTGVERISKQRWKLRCSICDIREGACIQCAKSSCFVAFHATCARREKLLLPMKSSPGAEPMTLTSYCERHLPKEHQDARSAALASQRDDNDSENPASHDRHSKSARAYAKTYKPGPPLVPAIIVDRIMQYIAKVIVRKKIDFLLMVCRYWSLKREARRGAPLLKRLHLEPWTANASLKPQSDEEKMMKLELLQRLRQDLESVHELSSRAHQRELKKLAGMQIIHNLLAKFILPHEPPLRQAFERIISFDRSDFFKNPVSKTDVPDYFDIVKRPMCWSYIETKLDRHEYWDIQTFKDDVNLVLSNAVLYNPPGTAFHKTATRMQGATKSILDDLDKLIVRPTTIAQTAHDPDQSDMTDRLTPPVETTLGDLEPALEDLEMLLSADVIKDNLDMVLEVDPLSSIFSYEFAKAKPPPPPPPPKPPKPPKAPKPKRDRTEEYARRREQRKLAAATVVAARLTADLEASSGMRAPRTRRERAKVAAFEAEARGEVLPASEEPEDMMAEPDVLMKLLDPTEQGPVSAEEPQITSSAPPEPSQLNSESESESESQGVDISSKSRRVPPPPPELPPLVDSVDNQSSFKLFEKGWILPPDARRGGRAPVERQALIPPLPRKRARTNESSRMSVHSASASENHAPQQSGDGTPTPSNAGTQEATKPRAGNFLLNNEVSLLPSSLVILEDGTKVVEMLDTPATRNARYKQIKARRQSQNTVAPQNLVSGSSQVPPEAGPSQSPVRRMDDETSSLSELSEDEAKAPEPKPLPQPLEPQPAPPPPLPVTSPVIDKKGFPATGCASVLPNVRTGTIVWAKTETYPWWPATIHERFSLLIPVRVARDQSHAQARFPNELLHPVQFFDRTKSWAWLPAEKLRLLGVDEAVDAGLRKQKWKAASVKSACLASFKAALAAKLAFENQPLDQGATPVGVEDHPVVAESTAPPEGEPNYSQV